MITDTRLNAPSKLDPITFSVMLGAFRSLVNEMNLTMFRTAYSPIITEGRDIGAMAFTADGHLISQGDHDLAVFVAMLEFTCRYIVDEFDGDIDEGDIFMTNDPFIGGSHFNDVGIIKPVFIDGQREGFVAITGHWPDIGGSIPGSFVPNAKEYYAEGIRIPPLKICERGRLVRGVEKLLMANVRVADERQGDLRAQIGTVELGARRFEELVARFTLPTVRAFMDEAIAYSERLLRHEIASMPDGVYEFEDFIDRGGHDDDGPMRVKLALTVAGDQLHFNFDGSAPQSPSASNSTYSCTASAVYITVKMLFPHIPMNYGCMRPIALQLPTGTVVNAQPPAATSSMASTVFEKVIACVLGALAGAVPDKVMASCSNLINLTVGGTHPDSDKYFVMYLYAEGGFGARATRDGSSGLVALFGGGARITPVEVYERRYPIRFREWHLWENSAGPGRYRGGFGSIKTFEVLGDVIVTSIGDRELFPGWGLLGGGIPQPHGLKLNYHSNDQRDLTLKCIGYQARAGDQITLLSGGGGGYGDPFDRDETLVSRDVVDELISAEHARDHYGVVVTDGSVDRDATAALRATRSEKGDRA